jgi:hypothetical protein
LLQHPHAPGTRQGPHQQSGNDCYMVFFEWDKPNSRLLADHNSANREFW